MTRESDVLIENYIPGKLTNLGLGFEQLSRIAPHLVYCLITGKDSASSRVLLNHG
ncbi:hypothetical protein DPMN_064432 [Dreissena polymorpha]|uniref:Uncharacterized protein n=1 Tax=Dreissena polymorpha TaxID=45954 RepID=A0A9D4HL21_DREPO|nr:hypothetical protein DPMN_064432 [Dreissena polymorpha]